MPPTWRHGWRPIPAASIGARTAAFGVAVARSWWRFSLRSETEENDDLVKRIAASGVFDKDVLVVVLDARHNALHQRLAALPGARLL